MSLQKGTDPPPSIPRRRLIGYKAYIGLMLALRQMPYAGYKACLDSHYPLGVMTQKNGHSSSHPLFFLPHAGDKARLDFHQLDITSPDSIKAFKSWLEQK